VVFHVSSIKDEFLRDIQEKEFHMAQIPGYIGADPAVMEATVAQFNSAVNQMLEAHSALETQIAAIVGAWVGGGKDTFDALVQKMKDDFFNAQLGLSDLAKQVGDFNEALQMMDANHAKMFAV
jgi:WXG100 family type VII secretion target